MRKFLPFNYIAKAAIDNNAFISQKGDGEADHKNWVTSGYMSTLGTNEGGDPRQVYAKKDRSMASIKSDGQAIKYTPQNMGVYYATVR